MVLTATGNAECLYAEIHEILSGIWHLSSCEKPVHVIHGVKAHGSSLVVLVNKKILLDPSGQPCLEEACQNAIMCGRSPSRYCGRSDHPFKESMKNVVSLDDVTVTPSVRGRDQQAEADMPAADA